jgi:lantibiotic biosynthesis protein
VLQRHDLPTEVSRWDAALDEWRARWRCPARVELQDLDQLLPLDLTVPAHVQVVFKHLRANDFAVLSEAPEADADDWCAGHNHTVVLPLTSTAPPEPGPRVHTLPVLVPGYGHAPGSDRARWLYIKLFVPAYRMDALVTREIPRLIDMLDDRPWWFVRYPQSTSTGESDQLRLRISVNRAPNGSADRSISDMDETMATVAAWADGLRAAGRIGRYVFDTYLPEVGRYLAIDAADDLFAADSRFAVVLHALTASAQLSSQAATVLSMFDMVSAVLGDHDSAAAWFNRQIPKTKFVSGRRDALTEVQALARNGLWQSLPGWPDIAAEHARWHDCATQYRWALPAGADIDEVLHSLLHMLHNRALGADRDSEARCLHLARATAATWMAFHRSPDRRGEGR